MALPKLHSSNSVWCLFERSEPIVGYIEVTELLTPVVWSFGITRPLQRGQ